MSSPLFWAVAKGAVPSYEDARHILFVRTGSKSGKWHPLRDVQVRTVLVLRRPSEAKVAEPSVRKIRLISQRPSLGRPQQGLLYSRRAVFPSPWFNYSEVCSFQEPVSLANFNFSFKNISHLNHQTKLHFWVICEIKTCCWTAR